MQGRTRTCAVGLILSAGAPFGGLLVPENSVSGAGIFSFEARAAAPVHARASGCRWNGVEWQAMSDQQKTAWQALGWNEQIWESDTPAEPASNSKIRQSWEAGADEVSTDDGEGNEPGGKAST